MITAMDHDLAALVGEMEPLACEHSQHGDHPMHSDEPATHYVRGECAGCTPAMVYPACPGYIASIRKYLVMKCGGCGLIGPMAAFVTILGPIGGTK